ncbi:hypothetical protein JHW43_000375 [Diplocarpon mali]|nr:hypothetical protein JHW43_000375 [Diplocarpon mali]
MDTSIRSLENAQPTSQQDLLNRTQLRRQRFFDNSLERPVGPQSYGSQAFENHEDCTDNDQRGRREVWDQGQYGSRPPPLYTVPRRSPPPYEELDSPVAISPEDSDFMSGVLPVPEDPLIMNVRSGTTIRHLEVDSDIVIGPSLASVGNKSSTNEESSLATRATTSAPDFLSFHRFAWGTSGCNIVDGMPSHTFTATDNTSSNSDREIIDSPTCEPSIWNAPDPILAMNREARGSQFGSNMNNDWERLAAITIDSLQPEYVRCTAAMIADPEQSYDIAREDWVMPRGKSPYRTVRGRSVPSTAVEHEAEDPDLTILATPEESFGLVEEFPTPRIPNAEDCETADVLQLLRRKDDLRK